jgi:MFS family permease
MEGIGRKNCVGLGIIIMAFGTLMFALGGYCTKAFSFLAVSFVARLLQGIADGIISVVLPSILAI